MPEARPEPPGTDQGWQEEQRSAPSPDLLHSPEPQEPEEGAQPPEPGAMCISSENVLWKRYRASVAIFCEITYLERVSLFQHHKTEILEIDVTTFVKNWHGQLILQIHHGETLPAPKV